MTRTPRLLTALLVAAALSTPAFSREAPRHAAAERRPKAAAPVAQGSVLAELWRSLTNVLGEVVTGDIGCGFDPYGTCRPHNEQQPTAENGCGLDPYGTCQP